MILNFKIRGRDLLLHVWLHHYAKSWRILFVGHTAIQMEIGWNNHYINIVKWNGRTNYPVLFIHWWRHSWLLSECQLCARAPAGCVKYCRKCSVQRNLYCWKENYILFPNANNVSWLGLQEIQNVNNWTCQVFLNLSFRLLHECLDEVTPFLDSDLYNKWTPTIFICLGLRSVWGFWGNWTSTISHLY